LPIYSAAGFFDDVGITVAVGQGFDGAWREDPQLGVFVHLAPLDEPGHLPDLIDGVMRASQHYIIDIATLGVGIQTLIYGTLFPRSIAQRFNGPLTTKSLIKRKRFRCNPHKMVHFHTA